ncbi:unnamed protein product, partial [Rotaria socialis]
KNKTDIQKQKKPGQPNDHYDHRDTLRATLHTRLTTHPDDLRATLRTRDLYLVSMRICVAEVKWKLFKGCMWLEVTVE